MDGRRTVAGWRWGERRRDRRWLLRGAAVTAGSLPSRAFRAVPKGMAGAGKGTTTRLEIEPNPAAVDAPLRIRLLGLARGDVVTLRTEEIDGAGVPWTGEARFLADASGLVDVGTQAPLAGTYGDSDPMGLVWSALPPFSPESGFYVPRLDPGTLRVTAERSGTTIAGAEVVREVGPSAVPGIDVDETGLYGRLYRPAGKVPAPGLLVLGGSEGGLSPYVGRLSALFARHGYAALALAYFGVETLPAELARIPLEYFGEALEWLRARPEVRAARIGIVGLSRGGELALLLGTTYPACEVVVSYVGSGVVLPAPGGDLPAWSLGGRPVPWLSETDPASWDRATIPVERINGPVLLLSGENDALWPSAELSELAMVRLRDRGHPFPFAHHRYAGAGHGLQPPYLPTTAGGLTFGGSAQGTAAANADSWPRVLGLLDARLRR